jgi:outer membrane protein TolC
MNFYPAVRKAILSAGMTCLLATAWAQFPSAVTSSNEQNDSQSNRPQAPAPQIPTDSPYLGSVPQGAATSEVLKIGILDALDRGLKFNLGVLLGDQGTRAAKGAKMVALSDLLPHLNGRVAETSQQTNLAALGFPGIPGIPTVVGPFKYFDARVTGGQAIFDLNAINNNKAAAENVKAAELTYQDARERVVVVIANLYMELLTNEARLEAANAELATANEIFTQSQDLKNSGVAAGIDVLRAQVQSQNRLQQATAAANEVQKTKLALARAIGLPTGQQFEITDKMPVALPEPITLEMALQHAYDNRNDLKRAESAVRAAELNKKAIVAKELPSLRFDGDYGDIGNTPASSHGSYSATVSLKIPIFNGGKTQGEVKEADATLNQRRAELADYKGKIDAEVRSNFFDLQTAIKQFQAAQTSVELANQQLAQSRDRFAAGVAGSLEVTQSQEAVASANENYIASLYSLDFSQARLALVLGEAETKIRQFLGASK